MSRRPNKKTNVSSGVSSNTVSTQDSFLNRLLIANLQLWNASMFGTDGRILHGSTLNGRLDFVGI